MSAFARKVGEITGVPPDRLQRLAGGDLSEVILVHRADGTMLVAKGGAGIAAEAAMLRAIRSAGAPAPMVEGEHAQVLLLEHVDNDELFSPAAWSHIGHAVRRLHEVQSETYGWPVDYRLGSVELDNRQTTDWLRFWGEQRLVNTAALLDRPWRDRVQMLVGRLGDVLPASPPPAFLHGDLWSGNILVKDGRLAALIDPACYYGDPEVDLAMLALFSTPPAEFWESYGPLPEGWEVRRAAYQLFPALVHMRLFGVSYAAMADRLLTQLGS